MNNFNKFFSKVLNQYNTVVEDINNQPDGPLLGQEPGNEDEEQQQYGSSIPDPSRVAAQQAQKIADKNKQQAASGQAQAQPQAQQPAEQDQKSVVASPASQPQFPWWNGTKDPIDDPNGRKPTSIDKLDAYVPREYLEYFLSNSNNQASSAPTKPQTPSEVDTWGINNRKAPLTRRSSR